MPLDIEGNAAPTMTPAGARVAQLYAEGLSIKQIAKITGWSVGTVHRYLVLGSVTRRSRGRPRKGAK